MAQIRVDVIGDSTSLKRALAEAGGAANTAGGHFTSLAKTMVGLGAAFLGASSILEGFKKSVDAAEALNAATRQLDAQLRANGESVKAVTPFVAQLNSEFEKLGFTSADTEAAFTRLDRASGSAALAYKEMGLAADLARAKNISFQQAALLIGKVIDGNTSALNRYGIAIPKGTSAIDALAIAHQKLAGQAAAAATPMKVFSATVTDVAAKIGNELLPVIDKYLGSLDKWLSKSENQKKITDDVAKGVKLFEEAISAAPDVIKAMVGPTEAVVGALGGFKKAIEDLIALKVALTLTGWATSFTAVGASAEGAKGKLSGLSGMLKSLPTAVAITVGLNIIENAHTTKSGLHRYSGAKGWANLGNDLAGVVGLDWQGGGTNNGLGGTPGQLGSLEQAGSTSGGKNDVGLFINDLISAFGGKQSAATKNVLAAWQRMEGGSTNNPDSYNFLNTTLKMPGSVGTGNVDGVQAYQSFKQGLDATIQTLNHGYPAIIQAIRTGNWAPTPELASELSKWSGGGYSSILASAGSSQSGPPGSLTPPDVAGSGSSKVKKPPAYKIPQQLEASIRTAQDTFKNDLTTSHLDTLKSLLSQEESLLKAHGQQAKAASVANEITDAEKKLADSFDKLAVADGKAAVADAQKAAAAFSKGQFGPAAKYAQAEVKNLKDAKAELEKAISVAPAGDRAAYEKQLAEVTKELASLKGVAAWIEGVAKIIGNFSAKLKAEGAKYTALLTQQTAASELQAVGYFADTADTLTAINKSIVTSLEAEKQTLTQEQDALKAKLASAPAALKAGLQAQITAIGGKITSLTSSISTAMGTVEQDLASAVTAAQQQFQTAVGNLQSTLDAQIQTNAMNASGATSDAATLSSMQAADQLKGLTDSVSAAQKALDADTAAGSQATADQIAQDQASLAAAKRSLDEYNLSIKVQSESAAATADATDKTNQFDSALGDLEGQLLSGKITAAQFETSLAQLGKQFGVNIDTTGAQFLAVASAASGVVGAFDSLISWINSQTGSNIPQVGGAGGSTANPFPPGANTTNTGGPGGGGFNVPLGAQNYNPPAAAIPPGSNIHTPGLQFAMGGIVPGNLGQPQFAIVHGGELVVPVGGFGGQSQRSIAASSRGGGGDIHIHVAGSVVAEKELMQLIRTQSARSSLRGTTVFGPT